MTMKRPNGKFAAEKKLYNQEFIVRAALLGGSSWSIQRELSQIRSRGKMY